MGGVGEMQQVGDLVAYQNNWQLSAWPPRSELVDW